MNIKGDFLGQIVIPEGIDCDITLQSKSRLNTVYKTGMDLNDTGFIKFSRGSSGSVTGGILHPNDPIRNSIVIGADITSLSLTNCQFNKRIYHNPVSPISSSDVTTLELNNCSFNYSSFLSGYRSHYHVGCRAETLIYDSCNIIVNVSGLSGIIDDDTPEGDVVARNFIDCTFTTSIANTKLIDRSDIDLIEFKVNWTNCTFSVTGSGSWDLPAWWSSREY